MLDLTLRPLKDRIFDPICVMVPHSISPLQLTAAAFVSGTLSCTAAAFDSPLLAFTFWILNRSFDCLDGAVARQRGEASDVGGFLDLLSDFIIYSAIPICCTVAQHSSSDVPLVQRRWMAVALVESTFHVNNFVLFFVAALAEKQKVATSKSEDRETPKDTVKELTTLTMRPALVEGTESGVIFSIMLAVPRTTELLCWILAGGVIFGTAQRVVWTVSALSKEK